MFTHNRTQNHSCSASLLLRPTHTYSDSLTLRLTRTQSCDALALRFADGGDVSSETLVSTPQGEAASGPFAARLWGCLRRYSSLVSQTPLLSGQIARMSRARRWLQLPKGGAAMGYGIRPLAARLRGYLERGVRFAPATPVHSETPCHLDVRRRAAAREEGGRRRKGEKGGHQVVCLSAGSLAW